MTRKKTSNEYAAEAKKLLAWWQEALHKQMRDPDALNAWLSTMQPPSTSSKGKPKTHAAQSRPTTTHDEPDATIALYRELSALRARVAKLERAVATSKPKPLAKSVVKPVAKRKPARKSGK